MKLSGGSAAKRLVAEHGETLAGLLLYGPDPSLVSLTRQELVRELAGPDAEGEMRLVRLAAADLRRDPAAIGDALRARGFFPGPRAVVVADATDTVASVLLDALADHRPGDATLVVTAGALAARSTLRKGFESAKAAAAVALYPDPPGQAEIEARLKQRGFPSVQRDAVDALLALGAEEDPGAFNQLLEHLALFCHGHTEVTAEDVDAVAPTSGGGDIDALLHAAAEGNAGPISPQIQRLAARGTSATTLVIAAARHFRVLHAAACAPDGPESALGRMRPPVFGPRRTRIAAQARRLGTGAAEKALTLLTETDLALRSSRPVPAFALVERTLIRIAMLPVR